MRILHAFLATSLLIPALAVSAEIPAATLRTAAQKGLALLEKTSPTFIKKGGCNSCHNQMLPAAAQAFARRRGIATGETIAQLPPEVSEATTERFIEYAVVGANSLGYELFAYAAANRPADARLAAQVYALKGSQEPEGLWRAGGNRPPLTFDDFTTTAYAIYALNVYTPEAQRADTEARIARARSWLLEAKPETTHERAFQLLGLAWSKAGRDSLERAARGLKDMQRKDGGWSQLPAMASDAYATGMSLFALAEGGGSVTDVTYQRGLRYLLDTQAADGTWHVKSRALPVQPYFESGYPYGHDQWISAAGAAYATMAIAAAVEPQRAALR
jgi:prenyltransferase/squalene oxidase-like repeat protein